MSVVIKQSRISIVNALSCLLWQEPGGGRCTILHSLPIKNLCVSVKSLESVLWLYSTDLMSRPQLRVKTFKGLQWVMADDQSVPVFMLR